MIKKFALTVTASLLFALPTAGPAAGAPPDGKETTAEVAAVKIPDVVVAKTSEVFALKVGKGTDEILVPIDETSKFPTDGPSSFAIDTNENFYVLDTENSRVLVISGGKIVSRFAYPEGETETERSFGRDIAVSPVDRKVLVLNHTLKNIFVFTPDGKLLGDIGLSEFVKSPHKISVAADGKICVRDEDEMRIVILNPDGKLFASRDGSMIAPLLGADGYLFSLGEFDDNGRDIVMMDPTRTRDPKVFGRLVNSYPKNHIYDYQIIGADARGRLCALAVEQVKMDDSRPVFHWFDAGGKLERRLATENFWGLNLAVPTRQYAVSPAGNLYAFDTDYAVTKFTIIKIE